MSRYSFNSLSSQDFEELVRDLLQAEWNVVIEAFKTGRDGGIDLRYAPIQGSSTIVQCKHFVTSGFAKLLSHLRSSELSKVERLPVGRYVVATSVGLTPANKDEIVAAMHPFIQGTGDVLGAQDLEGLLARHEAVEVRNFKLWLTSTTVLERVLHNAELAHTDFELDRIRRKLPLFVQSSAFPRARELLAQNKLIVLSGVPGIGKTTLAETLLYAHLEQGYEPVVIQGEVASGRKLFKASKKQIIYYDDFLGRTFLGDRKEYLGRNEDAAILDLMEMVQRSDRHRFILTTREHILSGALQVSERLAHSTLLQSKCILELRDYTYAQRARILYNHLYFSALSRAYKEAVLEDRFFLDIIKHRHFNPRLIDWLSTESRLKGVTPALYRAHIAKLLDSPESIWDHAYQTQISTAARHLLLSLYTIGSSTETVDLEPVFINLHRYCATKYNERVAPRDFQMALQELDGAFLTYNRDRASFLNPSLEEFVGSVVARERETVDDLIQSAIRFRQVANLWKLAKSQPQSELAAALNTKADLIFHTLSRLISGPSLRWEEMADGSSRGSFIDFGTESRIEFLIEVGTALKSDRFAALVTTAAMGLAGSWDREFPDFGAAIGLLKEIGSSAWFLKRGGLESYRLLLDSLLAELHRANADDWLAVLSFPEQAMEWTEQDEQLLEDRLKNYSRSGVYDDIGDCSSVTQKSELRDSFVELKAKYGLDLDSAIQSLDEEIAEQEEQDYDERRGYGGGGSSPFEEHMTDDDVSEMFNTLKE